MKKKTKYSKAPQDIGKAINQAKNISDFLPKPKDLITDKNHIKVTLSLSKDSVDFFKSQARFYGYSYQQMIRKVVDIYTKHHKQKKK